MRSHPKHPLIIGTFVLVLAAFSCSGSMDTEHSGRRSYNLDSANNWHALLEGTELSDLQDDLFGIINKRIACYQNNLMTVERVRDCRKTYVRDIVNLARERIRSVPKLGDSILCFQYCPMSHALCEGDDINGTSNDCIAEEARCIEYCLDQYWRGGTFSKDSPFSN